MRLFVILVLTAWVVGVPVVSWAQDPADATALYRIGPRDRLMVRVIELPDMNGEHAVGEDGTIELPRLGAILVRGATESQVAQRIEADLESVGLRDPSVTVRVTDFRSQPVSVLGAVQRPGPVSVRGSLPLFDVLLDAGGVTNERGRTIQIRRRAANGLTDRLDLDVDTVLNRADPTVNIPILPGDLINVEAARELTYYFMGEVAEAGQQTFLSTRGITLLTAIARVGGLSATASPKMRIMRLEPDGSRREIPVHYQRILEGRDADVEIVDGDIIVVKESFF